jgi:hypothetical protein
MQHGLHDPGKLIPSYAVPSRILVSSSTNVVKSAERVIQTILNAFPRPNLVVPYCTVELAGGLSARRRCLFVMYPDTVFS